jgi:hypothetical protein
MSSGSLATTVVALFVEGGSLGSSRVLMLECPLRTAPQWRRPCAPDAKRASIQHEAKHASPAWSRTEGQQRLEIQTFRTNDLARSSQSQIGSEADYTIIPVAFGVATRAGLHLIISGVASGSKLAACPKTSSASRQPRRHVAFWHATRADEHRIREAYVHIVREQLREGFYPRIEHVAVRLLAIDF